MRLTSQETESIYELSEQLRTVHIDDRSSLSEALPRIRQFLELDTLLVFAPAERLVGWGIERLDADNLPDERRFARLLAQHLERSGCGFAFFPLVTPASCERNKVVEVVKPHPEADVFRRNVLAPLELERHRQLHALVHEGVTLLAWVGALHAGEIQQAQHRRFSALLPAIRQRLSIERLMRRTRLIHAALDIILQHIGASCFLLSAKREIVFTNPAGRSLLDRDRKATVARLEEAVRNAHSSADVDLITLTARGSPPLSLVVLRSQCSDTRIEHCVAAAASRWRLTPRQREVLGLVIRGNATVDIADSLAISERAVELHITAIFDRLGIDNRAALVARVLLPS